MKHTIKLLTLAFMLATILTLTGCPGPVNTVVPCTHENKKTETTATCTEPGLEKIICADCGKLIKENTIEALGHDFGKWDVTEPIHSVTKCEDGKKVHTCSRCNKKVEEVIPVEHDFELTEHIIATCTECEKLVAVCKVCKTKITNEKPALGHSYGNWNVKEATCTTDGTKKRVCSRCGHEEIETIPAHHTFIAGGCDKCGAYEHNKEDDYQIMAYVYSSVEDAKKGENETVLYFSFSNNTTGIPQIVIGKNGPEITVDDLVQMKNGYVGKTVKYFSFQINWFLQDIEEKREYPSESIPLTNLENKDVLNNVSPVYIVIE